MRQDASKRHDDQVRKYNTVHEFELEFSVAKGFLYVPVHTVIPYTSVYRIGKLEAGRF